MKIKSNNDLNYLFEHKIPVKSQYEFIRTKNMLQREFLIYLNPKCLVIYALLCLKTNKCVD